VLQRETVMHRDKVDARPRPAPTIAVNVGRAGDARGHLGHQPLVALPEPAHRVAVPAVPFGPAGWEIAELIAVRADIPRLGDQFDPGQRRILANRIEERAAL